MPEKTVVLLINNKTVKVTGNETDVKYICRLLGKKDEKPLLEDIDCAACARYMPKKNQCAVFLEPPEHCWAFTRDKNWHKDVRTALENYLLGK